MTDTAITPTTENTGFKGILVTLYQRVILSYGSTLIGIGIVAAGVFVDAMVASPNKIVSVIGGIIGGVLALYKSPTIKATAP